ncbi:glutathione-dependent formaldehyde dehydrogenase, partial [Pseudomonas syringae pv. tagetis]
LSDILSSAWEAVTNGVIGTGSSGAIYGAGRGVLMSAGCEKLLGAEKIFMVGHHPDSLAYAQIKNGVIQINRHDVEEPAHSLSGQPAGMRREAR